MAETERPRSATRAEKTLELIRINEELEWAAALASGRDRFGASAQIPDAFQYLTSLRPVLPGEQSRDVLRRFVDVFADEIAAVRAARNRAAHAFQLDDRSLEAAVSVAKRLEAILRQQAPGNERDTPAASSDW